MTKRKSSTKKGNWKNISGNLKEGFSGDQLTKDAVAISIVAWATYVASILRLNGWIGASISYLVPFMVGKMFGWENVSRTAIVQAVGNVLYTYTDDKLMEITKQPQGIWKMTVEEGDPNVYTENIFGSQFGLRSQPIPGSNVVYRNGQAYLNNWVGEGEPLLNSWVAQEEPLFLSESNSSYGNLGKYIGEDESLFDDFSYENSGFAKAI